MGEFIKDRKDVKWKMAMILPEHKVALLQLQKEQDDQTMPELDEQKVEEIYWTIQRAMRENKPVEVTYYENKRYHIISGHILRMDTVEGLRIENEGMRKTIPKLSIINIECW